MVLFVDIVIRSLVETKCCQRVVATLFSALVKLNPGVQEIRFN